MGLAVLCFIVVAVLCLIILISGIVWKIHSRLTCARCNSNVCLEGKTALVTGGSCGLGYYIACGLASRGCKVIIADKIINEDIKNAIYKETRSDKISFEFLDLGSFKSVRDFAKRIKASEDKLDILINNAGIGKSFGSLTEDGLNGPMQINYYGHFLLTHLLVDLLKKAPSARLIFASSAFAFFSKMSVNNENPEDIEFGTMTLDYQHSKLCQIVAADMFGEKLKNYNITSNSFHPGVVRTGMINAFIMGKGMTIYDYLLGIFVKVMEIVQGKTGQEGAQTALHLACSNEVEGVTKEFFDEAMPRSKPQQASNEIFCKTLWRHSERIVQLKPEERLS